MKVLLEFPKFVSIYFFELELSSEIAKPAGLFNTEDLQKK